ncbi:MAG: Trk system potassium transport protein TrkA [Bacteroidetes bacterium 4572_77]|nr:MAG: Trk system potassium transport protein TrkA [Bacteroidetes bacterium 4572_77]
MNIIIAGDGEVGLHLAKLLTDEQHNITFIDSNDELLNMVSDHSDLMAVVGSSISVDVLEEANVKNADLLIAVLHDEAVNILTAILGKKLGARKTIARISNREFMSPKNIALLEEKGVDILINPEQVAANEIVQLLKQSAATEVFEFSDGKLQLFLIKLEKYAIVVNKTLNQIATEFPKIEFRAVAIHREGKTIIPSGNDYFRANDLAYVITKPEGVDLLLQLGGKQNFDINDIMIVGGGRIGRMTALALQNQLNIKLIESSTKRAVQLTNDLDHTLIINSDARDMDMLDDEGIRQMDAFIAVTNHTETNILTCLHARKLGVKRTIALVENIEYIDIAQNTGIDTIINKRLTTAGVINLYTMEAKVTTVKCLNGINADVIEVVAMPKSAVTKKPLKKLSLPKGSIIGGIIRGEDSYIAVGDFQLEAGDKAVVFALPSALHKINKMFKH